MTTASPPDVVSQQLPQQKLEVLLAFHRVCWEEMTWRRNAGYRTVILGLGFCAAMVLALACNHGIQWPLRICLAAVMTVAYGSVAWFGWERRILHWGLPSGQALPTVETEALHR